MWDVTRPGQLWFGFFPPCERVVIVVVVICCCYCCLCYRFRHQVSQLYNASQISRDWAGTVSSTLSIRVKREKLMQDSLALFKQVNHPTSLLGMAGLIGLTGWADLVGLI